MNNSNTRLHFQSTRFVPFCTTVLLSARSKILQFSDQSALYLTLLIVPLNFNCKVHNAILSLDKAIVMFLIQSVSISVSARTALLSMTAKKVHAKLTRVIQSTSCSKDPYMTPTCPVKSYFVALCLYKQHFQSL